MTNPIAILQELEVTADLNKIIKYHPASAVFLNEETEKEYSTTLNVKILVSNVDGKQFILPDYEYANIIDKTLPQSGHDNNLLLLVRNLVQLEWGYFESYYILDKKKESFVNLHTKVTNVLNELKILVSILEEDQTRNVVCKLNLTELKKAGENDKRYNVPGMQIEVSDEDESLAIIRLLANNRIKELSKPDYYFYNFDKEDFTAYTSEQIQQAINRMLQPFRDFRAKWLFSKLVCEKILAYLKGEMNWNQGNIEITEEQGVIIHTLLALFHLIEPEQEFKNITDRRKAKYVRTFFRKDVNTDEAFMDFTKVKPGDDVKRFENQWFYIDADINKT